MEDNFKDGTYKIILFNGPPRAGKDTAVELLREHEPNLKLEKFAAPLKSAVRAFYGLTADEWAYWDSAENKDVRTDVFLGKTCREAQIAMSEVYAKPFHGNNAVLGQLLADRIVKWHSGGVICVSDSGFVEEVYPIISRFGSENVKLVRIHREGHDFAVDSRSYIYVDAIESFDLHNNGSKAWYKVELVELLNKVKYSLWGKDV